MKAERLDRGVAVPNAFATESEDTPSLVCREGILARRCELDLSLPMPSAPASYHVGNGHFLTRCWGNIWVCPKSEVDHEHQQRHYDALQ